MQPESKSKFAREQLLEQLKQHYCEVEFTKVNGTRRVMPCTLKADAIPAQPVASLTEKRIRSVNEAVITVWCTDVQDWRSFRIENVTGFRTLNTQTGK